MGEVKAKYPSVSYSDLWIFAAYVFIRASGGPDIKFEPGRKDAGEDRAIAPGRLPEAEHGVCPGMDAEGRVNGWQKNADEVRPIGTRRQYAGYAMDDDSTCGDDLKLGDLDEFPVGKWMVDAEYINIRMDAETGGPIIGRANKGETFFIIATLAEDQAVLGRISCGGWVCLRGLDGNRLFKRVEDLKLPSPLRIRLLRHKFVPYKKNDKGEMITTGKKVGLNGKNVELVIREINVIGREHYGKLTGNDGMYMRLVAPEPQVFWERISKGWNDDPRYVNIPEVRTQMMLVSDMILVWDEEFRKHLEVYADDEDELIRDFGDAFKRLTENGFKNFPKPHPFKPAQCPAQAHP